MRVTNECIEGIRNKFSIKEVDNYLKKLKNLSVLVIGDTIIDHYSFVNLRGRAIKDPILSATFKYEERYAGGIVIVANHVSSFVKNIRLVTLLGDRASETGFIQNALSKNINLKIFVKEDSPTTVKKRFIDAYRNNKLFKVECINDTPINEKLTRSILEYLNEELPKYDLVIVDDFGHGFINEAIRRKLEEKSKFLAINVQSNSANMGFNYFTLYKKFNFISMNEQELRLPLYRRFEKIDDVINEAHNTFKLDKFLVTMGKKGCIFINRNKIFKMPILISSTKDTVGAGDALFAVASLCTYLRLDDELIPFIANCVGGFAANITGNKESITKEKLLDFIKGVYNE